MKMKISTNEKATVLYLLWYLGARQVEYGVATLPGWDQPIMDEICEKGWEQMAEGLTMEFGQSSDPKKAVLRWMAWYCGSYREVTDGIPVIAGWLENFVNYITAPDFDLLGDGPDFGWELK